MDYELIPVPHLSLGSFPGGSVVKDLPAKRETQVQALGQKYPLEKEMETHSNILAWDIPWTEVPGGLQSVGLQRVQNDLAVKQQLVIVQPVNC